MEREYIRDRTPEGRESARTRGQNIGGATVTDDAMLSPALHLREKNLSLREIAAELVITKGKKKGRHPSPATVLRMLREHDEAKRSFSALTAVPDQFEAFVGEEGSRLLCFRSRFQQHLAGGAVRSGGDADLPHLAEAAALQVGMDRRRSPADSPGRSTSMICRRPS
ncbi:hypothetical protein AB0C18_28900 [Nonomuraea muscovyensis]|uniref:hypothetical protein n=1 Tax=Nonomuraea muscovyensis TaxID=1124761 RepID=UPI0033FBC0B7